jgi:hypothetical protein
MREILIKPSLHHLKHSSKEQRHSKVGSESGRYSTAPKTDHRQWKNPKTGIIPPPNRLTVAKQTCAESSGGGIRLRALVCESAAPAPPTPPRRAVKEEEEAGFFFLGLVGQ